MPIAFRCPGCAQALKVPDTMAGRSGKCPKCGTVLLVPAMKAAAEVAPARKARPPGSAVVEEKAVPARRRPGVESNGDEAPEEPIPPRQVRKKKKAKKSPVLLFGLVGAGCFGLLMCCSGIGGLAWWLWPSSFDDDLKYVPNNCQIVASVRWDDLMQSEAFKQMKREFPEVNKELNDSKKELGLSPDDIDQIVFGAANAKEFIVVIRTKKEVTAADLRSKDSKVKYTESKVGKYLLQEPQDSFNPAFCVVDKKRFLVGEKGALRAVLTRDKKPEFSKNLEAAMKEVDFKKTVAFAMDTQFVRSQASNLGALGKQKDALGAFGKMNGVAAHLNVRSDVDIKMVILCQDTTTANDVKKMIDGFLAMGRNVPDLPKEASDLLNVDLKVDGKNVVGNKTIKIAPLIKVAKEQKSKG
jgi:hypothetical protein